MILRRSALAGRLSLEDELQTFINDRTEHVETLILPRLAAGEVVVLDRYFYSTIAYQGARGANVASVRSEMLERFPVPDAVFILDVDPAIGIHRIANDRGDEPNHFENRANLALAREIFQGMIGENIFPIDGSLSIYEVHKEILRKLVDGPLRAEYCAKSYGCDDPQHCSRRWLGSCRWWNILERLRVQGSSRYYRTWQDGM
jgi:dTMP kinase